MQESEKGKERQKKITREKKGEKKKKKSPKNDASFPRVASMVTSPRPAQYSLNVILHMVAPITDAFILLPTVYQRPCVVCPPGRASVSISHCFPSDEIPKATKRVTKASPF